MTIAAVVLQAGPFTGNGVTTSFPFTFKCFGKTEMTWTRRSSAGVEAVLVLDLDYSVTLNGDQNASPGGSITFPLGGSAYAILAASEKLVGVSNAPETQLNALVAAGGFFPQVIENALDRAVLLTQQISQLLTRTLSYPVTDAAVSAALPTSTQRAGMFLAFDSSGNPIAANAVTGAPASIAMQPVISAATLAAARAAMGVNPALATSLITGAYSTVATDNVKTLQCSGTFNLSLGDAATLGAGWFCNIVNAGAGLVTVNLVTAGNTLNGAANGSIVLPPFATAIVAVNQGVNGFNILAASPNRQGTTVASAATVNLDATSDDFVHISGVVAITAITLSKGAQRTVVFDGALTLTNGASLLLPGAANIVTAAGDAAIFRGEAAGVVRCIGYTRAAIAPNKQPTMQVLAGAGTYTTPAGVTRIRVHQVAAGGGGGGSCATASNNGGTGGTGGNTTFGGTLLVANGATGGGGTINSNAGAGGSTSNTAGPQMLASISGSGGQPGSNSVTASLNLAGGNGGPSPFGGEGRGGQGGGNAGFAAQPNSGSGGGGSGCGGAGCAGGGGGSGGYIDAVIVVPAATYAYAVGAGGTAGAAGTGGFVGGAGADGQITVEEFYS